jgi:uncharacterized membrane protein YfcA
MDFSALARIFDPYNLLPWQWAAWICFGLFAGLLKAGFSGLTVVLIPVLAVIFGARQSTGINLPLFCLGDVIAVLYYHRHAEWKYILKLLPWTLGGFAVAILVERIVPVQAFKYVMGGCIIAGLIVMVWNDLRGNDKPPPSAWWFSALFGIAGGFATTIGNLAGALMSVFLLSMRLPKNSFVGTTAWYFLIVNFHKLPIQVILWKNITAQTLLFDLTLVPVILAGMALGIFLVKKIPEGAYRRIIMVLTLISSVLLFV